MRLRSRTIRLRPRIRLRASPQLGVPLSTAFFTTLQLSDTFKRERSVAPPGHGAKHVLLSVFLVWLDSRGVPAEQKMLGGLTRARKCAH